MRRGINMEWAFTALLAESSLRKTRKCEERERETQ